MRKPILGVAFLLLSVTSLLQMANAISVPPQLIEQFKRLSPSEQQRLARQYGIEPSAVLSGGNEPQFQMPSQPLIRPRGDRQRQGDSTLVPPVSMSSSMKTELKPFGYELFAGEPSTYAPVTDVPVPPDYALGPGDELGIQLYGKETAFHRLVVDRSGAIAFPELGPVQLAGLSFADARQHLQDLVANKMIGMSANVTMGELRSIRIFVAGDAYRPGSYSVSALSTVTHALAMAGGLAEIGSLRNIQVRRNGKLIVRFDAYDLLLKGDASGDVRLQSGDVVFIPPIEASIAVEGDVRRPAIYELAGNERLADVLLMAGGVLPGAYPAASLVERFDDNHHLTVLSADLTAQKGQQIRARNGDRLIVRSGSVEHDGAVVLLGAVARPGLYQWRPGLRISDVVRSLHADLTWNTDAHYALIVRQTSARGAISTVGFRLIEAVRSPGGSEDKLLHPADKVLVFADSDEAIDRTDLDTYLESLLNAESDEPIAEEGINEQLDVISDQRTQLATELESLRVGGQLEQRTSIAGVAIAEDDDSSEEFERELSSFQEQQRLKRRLLLGLFQNKELIALSNTLNREELLLPVMEKLNSQASTLQGAQVVAIEGEVANPGLYPLPSGSRVSDVVALAGGLKEGAYLIQAELTRTLVDDDLVTQIIHRPVKLGQAMARDMASDIVLQGRDRLQVLTKPNWRDAQTIEVRGEVRFPGVYVIERGETLADIIDRAGGFTDYAYPTGGVFTRETVRRQEELEVERLINKLRKELASQTLVDKERSFTSAPELDAMLSQLEQVTLYGRLVVNFEEIIARNPAHNLPVEDGDNVYIPPLRNTISVMGEVQHASSHRFDTGLSYKDYLKLAGGLGQRADAKRTYIIRADGSVSLPRTSYWFGSQQQMQPGDTIIVPLDTEYKDGLTLWSQVTSIIYNSAVALAAIDVL